MGARDPESEDVQHAVIRMVASVMLLRQIELGHGEAPMRPSGQETSCGGIYSGDLAPPSHSAFAIDHFVTAITAGRARRSAGFSPLRIPTSPLYGVVFGLRFSFFLFD